MEDSAASLRLQKSFKSAKQELLNQLNDDNKQYTLSVMTNSINFDIILSSLDCQNKWNYHLMKTCREAEIMRNRQNFYDVKNYTTKETKTFDLDKYLTAKALKESSMEATSNIINAIKC